MRTLGAMIGAGITGRGRKKKKTSRRAPVLRKRAKKRSSRLCKGATPYTDSWYEGNCG